MSRTVEMIRHLRLLSGYWTFNNLADSGLVLLLAVWVRDATGDSGAAATVLAIQALPALLAPGFGLLADRYDRVRLVTTVNTSAFFVVLILLTVDPTSGYGLLLVFGCAFAYGSAAQLGSVTTAGLVRDLFDDDWIPKALARSSVIDDGLRIVVPVAGVLVYEMVGETPAFVVVAVSFGGASVIARGIPSGSGDPARSEERAELRKELSAGTIHLWRSARLRPASLAMSVALLFAGAASAGSIAVVAEGLGRNPSYLGLMVAGQGLGAVLAGLVVGRILGNRREEVVAAWGLALMALGFATYVAPHHPVVIFGSFIAGSGVALAAISSGVLRQRLTPSELQGRVAAATSFLLGGAVALGTGVGAALVAAAGFHVVFLTVTAGAATAAAAMAYVASQVSMASVD